MIKPKTILTLTAELIATGIHGKTSQETDEGTLPELCVPRVGPLNRLGEPSTSAELMADGEAARAEAARARNGGLP